MSQEHLYGYHGQILRVDLTKGTFIPEKSDVNALKQYVGGAALGMKYIYDEVPPSVAWNDPANRLYLGAGPLSGTRVAGSGSIASSVPGADHRRHGVDAGQRLRRRIFALQRLRRAYLTGQSAGMVLPLHPRRHGGA